MNKNTKENKYPIYILDLNLLTEPMRDGFERLRAAAKTARWTNAFTRKDGVETGHEADWITYMSKLEGESAYELRKKHPIVQDAYEKYLIALALVSVSND